MNEKPETTNDDYLSLYVAVEIRQELLKLNHKQECDCVQLPSVNEIIDWIEEKAVVIEGLTAAELAAEYEAQFQPKG